MTEETIDPEKIIPPPRKKLGWFGKIILGLNWFAIAGLFLACMSPFVSPAVFWPLAFFGLLHPAFVLLNFIFLLLWTIRWRKQAFYTLAILLFSIPWYGKQFRLGFSNSEVTTIPGSFKLMSYNVKLFDLYNWSGDKNARGKMFSLIAKEKPDLLNLQEFYTDSGAVRNLDSLKSLLGLPYVHVEYTFTIRKHGHGGVATFSKFPIVNVGEITFTTRNNNLCIYTDLLINGDTVRVYNMHLQSISLGYADMKFLDKVANLQESNDEVENSKNVLRRMKRAFVKRAHQSESIAKHISESPYPVIICGDFNDTPISYCYRTISEGMEDAYMESGSGFAKSFVNPFPFPRIDYILHSPDMKAYEFHSIQQNGLSDHYPVVCKIAMK